MKYLFSIKSKHIEANQRIRNQTRFLSILFATLFAIAFSGSCVSRYKLEPPLASFFSLSLTCPLWTVELFFAIFISL